MSEIKKMNRLQKWRWFKKMNPKKCKINRLYYDNNYSHDWFEFKYDKITLCSFRIRLDWIEKL